MVAEAAANGGEAGGEVETGSQQHEQHEDGDVEKADGGLAEEVQEGAGAGAGSEVESDMMMMDEHAGDAVMQIGSPAEPTLSEIAAASPLSIEAA